MNGWVKLKLLLNEYIYLSIMFVCTYLISRSVAEGWKTWEVLLDFEVLVNALEWLSLELGLVSLHLGDEVHEVLWFFEQFQLLGVDKVAQLVLNLDHELDHVQTVEAVRLEGGIERDGGLLCSSEIVLHH